MNLSEIMTVIEFENYINFLQLSALGFKITDANKTN
jgi:hypothetical protein